MIRTIDGQRRPRALLRRLRRQPRRRHLAGRSSARGLVFNTANPTGGVNYDRDFQAATGPQETYSKGLQLLRAGRDARFNRLTLNLGVRTERWEHFATTGDEHLHVHWEFAPRLSAAYDVLGNGKHKAVGVLGPLLRPDPQRHDQLRRHAHRLDPRRAGLRAALSKYVTYRTRGGPAVQDAFFSPTTKTPYTDDLQFGYAVDLGNNMSFDAALLQPPDAATSSRTTTSSSTRDPNGYPGPGQRSRTRCSSATTTSATPRTPARTSSSARSPAASATSRASSSCSASASPTTGRC